MKQSLFAIRTAPLQGLLAAAALHALAAQKLDVTPTPALAPAATDLDTGQPQTIAITAKMLGAGKQPLRRDSAGPPIGTSHGNKATRGVDKDLGSGVRYHRWHATALDD